MKRPLRLPLGWAWPLLLFILIVSQFQLRPLALAGYAFAWADSCSSFNFEYTPDDVNCYFNCRLFKTAAL